MFLEAECREVNPVPEDSCLSKNADAAYAVDFHFHVGIAVWVAEVSQMRSPCRILCIALDNDSIFVKSISKG
jgi:MOSC domain-containing protein YiiM